MSRSSWEPLPRGFFSFPRLSYDEEEYFRQLARASMKDLIVLNSFVDPTIRWKSTGDVDRIAMFQGDDLTPTQLTYVCAKMEVRGTIDEVASLFYPDDEPYANLRRVFPDLLDAQTIYALNLPSARAPRHYIGVQWMAFEAPSPLMKHRDFCFLECQDDFTDGSGRRGWARSLTSIRSEMCPELDSSSGMVRGSMYRTGCIFVEMELEGRLEVTYFVQIDYKGQVPKAMQISGMRRHIKSMALVESLILQLRLKDTPFLTEVELVPKHARRACQVCKVAFGTFQRRRRCRKCGEVVCLNCSSHVEFDELVVGPIRLRICSSCVLHVMLPNQFPNPLRSKSQRNIPDHVDDDEIHFGGNFKKTPRSKSKSKYKNDDIAQSIYAPREHLEQPRTPRRSAVDRRSSTDRRNSTDQRNDRRSAADQHTRSSSISISRQSEHTPSRERASSRNPMWAHIRLSSSEPHRSESRVQSTASASPTHYATPPRPWEVPLGEIKPSNRHASAPPPMMMMEEEEDMSKYSIHGMMARQRIQLQQRMQELHLPIRDTTIMKEPSIYDAMRDTAFLKEPSIYDGMRDTAILKEPSIYEPSEIEPSHAFSICDTDVAHPKAPSTQTIQESKYEPSDIAPSARSHAFSICDTDVAHPKAPSTQTIQESKYEPNDIGPSARSLAFSICDTDIARDHRPPPMETKSTMLSSPHFEGGPEWLDSIRAAPSLVGVDEDDVALQTMELSPGDNQPETNETEQLAADLATLMKSLQKDGKLDLNAAASHTLLDLYSKLKALKLDQQT
ncbi:unnamed protein product [Aphanomyces euteiches]